LSSPPSPRSDYDRKQRFAIALAVFVAAFIGAPLLIIGPTPEESLSPLSPLLIVAIAIAANAPFGNRDEAAPMGGVMADVKGGRRRRVAKAAAGGEAG